LILARAELIVEASGGGGSAAGAVADPDIRTKAAEAAA